MRKVQYLGKSSFLEHGKEYEMYWSANDDYALAEVIGVGKFSYESITDLALDWDILNREKFIQADVMHEYIDRMARLP